MNGRAEPVVEGLRAEYASNPAIGIGSASPRLSWHTVTSAADWAQAAYEVEVAGTSCGRVDGPDSVFVPWPTTPLRSREPRPVRVRVWGTDGSATAWSDALVVEAGLLAPDDWSAGWVTALDEADPRPQQLRRAFALEGPVERARLYVTSAGVHQLRLNGEPVGDRVLAPGWSAYGKRLRYDTHDVTDLLVGRRERPRRRRGRRLVARAPRVGDEAQRLRRSPRAPRAARGHLRRRHDRTGHDRRPLADGDRAAPGPARTSTTARPTTPAATSTAGRPRASTTPRGPGRSASGRPSASSWPRPRRPCAAIEELAVVEVITTPSGRPSSTSARTSSAGSASPSTVRPGTIDHPAPRRGARPR